MGYTHYWTNQKLTPADIADVQAAALRIFKATDIPLADGHGEQGTKPEAVNDGVFFNGVGEQSHESFALDFTSDEWTFCKTVQKPYDTVVVAILMAVKDVVPSFEWSSDGDDDDHADGKALYLASKDSKL